MIELIGIAIPIVSTAIPFGVVVISSKYEKNKKEIKEYGESFKREFQLDEREFLEKKIKEKFPHIEFESFEYKKYDIKTIENDTEENKNYIKVKVKGIHKDKIIRKAMGALKVSFKLNAKQEEVKI